MLKLIMRQIKNSFYELFEWKKSISTVVMYLSHFVNIIIVFSETDFGVGDKVLILLILYIILLMILTILGIAYSIPDEFVYKKVNKLTSKVNEYFDDQYLFENIEDYTDINHIEQFREAFRPTDIPSIEVTTMWRYILEKHLENINYLPGALAAIVVFGWDYILIVLEKQFVDLAVIIESISSEPILSFFIKLIIFLFTMNSVINKRFEINKALRKIDLLESYNSEN